MISTWPFVGLNSEADERIGLLVCQVKGTSDANIRFTGLCQLMKRMEFEERIRASHHIFTKEGVEEILNLQSRKGKAKPYQVRQVRGVILKYRMGDMADD